MGTQKSTNIRGASKVGGGYQPGVGGGITGLAEFNGGVHTSGAVPGAEINHFKKMLTQRAFSMRLVS